MIFFSFVQVLLSVVVFACASPLMVTAMDMATDMSTITAMGTPTGTTGTIMATMDKDSAVLRLLN